MTLSAGKVLQNRYRIASLLGQEGMGTVYRAWHLSLNLPVAVKEMVPQPGLDNQMLAQFRQQFQQEAVILARLNHPYLVGVIDFFEEKGNAYLVMQFHNPQQPAKGTDRLHPQCWRPGRHPRDLCPRPGRRQPQPPDQQL